MYLRLLVFNICPFLQHLTKQTQKSYNSQMQYKTLYLQKGLLDHQKLHNTKQSFKMADKTLKISQIGGHGISGLVTLYETLKQNKDLNPNEKIEVTVFDKLKGFGGPAWSGDTPLNKYLENTWTNTDISATDLTKDKLFNDFLDVFFNESPENKLVKEGFVPIDRIQEFKNKYSKPEVLESLKNNYNTIIAKIANGEELKYFAPRAVNGLFAEVLNDNIQKIVENSNDRISLNFIHGQVLGLVNQQGSEYTLKYKSFESGNESEITTNIILYHGGDSKRVFIEYKNDEVLNNKFVVQNPLSKKLESAVDAAIQKAIQEGRDKIFVALKGFGNTGQDTVRYIFERAKEADLKVEATIVTRNTNYISSHPIGKPDAALKAELSGKLLGAITAQERWSISKEYLDNAPIIKGTVIQADGSEPGEAYNPEKHKGKTKGHVALIIRSTLNKEGELDKGEYSKLLGYGFEKEFEIAFGIYRAFRNPTIEHLFDFIKEKIINGAIKLFGGKFENIEYGADGFSVDVGNNNSGITERKIFDLLVNAIDAKIDLRKNKLALSFEKFSLAVIDEITGFFKTKPGTSILLGKEGKELKSDLIVTNPVTALEQNGLSYRVVFVQQSIQDLSKAISEFFTNTQNKISFSVPEKNEPNSSVLLCGIPRGVVNLSPSINVQKVSIMNINNNKINIEVVKGRAYLQNLVEAIEETYRPQRDMLLKEMPTGWHNKF